MKRGPIAVVVCLSLILVLSLSLVSANIVVDILKNIFGVQIEPTEPFTGTFTGRVAGGANSCEDSDGDYNFDESGWARINEGTKTYDKCVGDVAYDYYCAPSGGDSCGYATASYCKTNPNDHCCIVGGETAAISLPLITNGITGNIIYSGDYVIAARTIDCMYEFNLPCNDGICGCTAPKSCSEPGVITCQQGTAACLQDGSYGPCTGAIYVGQTCTGVNAGKVCENVNGVGVCQIEGDTGGACTDGDGDLYVKQNASSSCAQISFQAGYGDCNDNNANINPGAFENTGTAGTCSDGVDNDCNGKIDSLDPACGAGSCVADPLNTTCGTWECGSKTNNCGASVSCGSCASGESCSSGQCSQSPQPECTKDDECTGGKVCVEHTGLCKAECTDNDGDGRIVESATAFNSGQCGFRFGVSLSSNNNELEFQQLATTSDTPDGYSDCNDSDPEIYPGADEMCDNLDNDCNGEIDEGLIYPLACGDECQNIEAGCVDGEEKTTCEDLGSTTPDADTCEEDPDEPLAEEGGECADAELTACGTNTGTCYVGVRYCENNVWGVCEREGKPTNEICNDNLDNDCDGDIDEGCSGGAVPGTTLPTESDQGYNDETPEEESEDGSFFEKILKFFLAVLQVGKVVLSPITGNPIAEEDRPCTDSDGGANYFVKGSGSGTSFGSEIWFQDACYKDSISNQISSCSGEGCFLSEKYCEGTEIRTELEVICQFGCVKGACVPESTSRNECEPYFDRDLFEWIDPC